MAFRDDVWHLASLVPLLQDFGFSFGYFNLKKPCNIFKVFLGQIDIRCLGAWILQPQGLSYSDRVGNHVLFAGTAATPMSVVSCPKP